MARTLLSQALSSLMGICDKHEEEEGGGILFLSPITAYLPRKLNPAAKHFCQNIYAAHTEGRISD